MKPGPLAAAHRFELIAVRHGRTAWNADGRFQGHADIPLDGTGRGQARALASALSGERFDAIVTSDLRRARETAEIIAATSGAAPEPDARWREMRFGEWEGLTWAQILAREPALAGRSLADPRGYVPTGGEAFAAVCERVADAVRAVDAAARDEARILVATHAGPLHALLRIALGEPAASALEVRFAPAGVTRLAFAPSGTRVLQLNGTLAARLQATPRNARKSAAWLVRT